jgi:hypothetical protein
VFANHLGTVKFFTSFTLTDVLCVPNFLVNLLSVSQLCKTSKYVLQFNTTQCSIQDISIKTMIDFADEFERLYYLNLQDKDVHANTIDASDNITIPSQATCHFRLGHLSNSKMQFLHSKFPYINVDNKSVCVSIILLSVTP